VKFYVEAIRLKRNKPSLSCVDTGFVNRGKILKCNTFEESRYTAFYLIQCDKENLKKNKITPKFLKALAEPAYPIECQYTLRRPR